MIPDMVAIGNEVDTGLMGSLASPGKSFSNFATVEQQAMQAVSASLSSPVGTLLSASPLTGGGLNAPTAIAIDEDGSAWVANFRGNSLSNFSAGFATLSPAGGFTGGGLAQPSGIAINPH